MKYTISDPKTNDVLFGFENIPPENGVFMHGCPDSDKSPLLKDMELGQRCMWRFTTDLGSDLAVVERTA